MFMARKTMRNIRLTVEYDGSGYCGWQVQPNGTSIQELIEEKIAVITQERVRLTGSGRTDAGVHALNQVANFRTESLIPCDNLLRGLNSMLPPDIVVKDLRDVEESFHARYDAKTKVYFYNILNCRVRSALQHRYSWHIRDILDREAMQDAGSRLVGTHDFSSFCAADSDTVNHVRTIVALSVEKKVPMIVVTVEANGFLRHMVRNIVGTLVDVGRGTGKASDIDAILEAKDRSAAGVTAPPQGLFLKEVRY